MKKKKIFQLTFSILFSTLLVVSLVYAWTAPTQNPPNGNVKPPINVSDAAQSKLGNFGLGGGVGQPLYWLKNVGGALYFSSTNPAGDRIVISQDGNVGIGATGPAEKLEVNGAIKIGTTSNTNAGTIRWTGTDFEGYTGSEWKSLTSGGGGLWTDQGAYIYPNNYNQFVIEDTGNVGIGTTNPATKLDVQGGWVRIGDATSNAIQFETQSGFHRVAFRDLRFWDWDTGGDMVAFNNGNVGIGTTNPQWGKVQIEDAAVPLAFRETDQVGAGSLWRMPLDATVLRFDVSQNGTDFAGGYITPLAMTKTGNVGIGTTNPAEDLHVYRGDSDVARIYATGANQGSGMIYVGQSTSYGGGLAYDGDGNPDIVGGTDRITFFRRNARTDYEVMSYRYSDNNVYFAGNVGIGMMSPQGRLHIKAAGSKVIIEI